MSNEEIDPGLRASLHRGLEQSAAGDTHDLGSFTQYVEHEVMAQPSAWQSLPGAVRFAVWLWTVAMIGGSTIGAIILGALLLGYRMKAGQ